MKNSMKKLLSIGLAVVLTVVCLSAFAAAQAAKLDEILEYHIRVNVNDDATLTLTYHIEWKVLDSTSEGPLEWVKVGIPNSHYSDIKALSNTIRKIGYMSSGGHYVRIDLDREYNAGDVAKFDFSLTTDYMYDMNRFNDGETVYEFTPGWFPGIEVDKLTIEWNIDRAISQSPACTINDGYYVWTTSLDEGERYTVQVTYPNEAFAFDASKTTKGGQGGTTDDVRDVFKMILGALFLIFMIWVGIKIIIKIGTAIYNATASFSSGTTKKKITREKIVYYPACQGCGAPRPEGKDTCEYCGRSFIQSKETVTEEEVPEDLKNKNRDGTYRWGSVPNTYIRIHTIPIVVPSVSGGSRHSGGSKHSGGGGSSCPCASSCACAHSCACACACACAGGGRAGCSTKDFYNTGLKLSHLEMKKRHARRKNEKQRENV